MQNEDDPPGRPAPAPTGRGLAGIRDDDAPAHERRRGRPRPSAVRLRRTLVLAERFNSLCALKSDPRQLIDLLGSVIVNARDSFAAVAGARHESLATEAPTNDQARCLQDLESLLRGLSQGAPEASRGLRHAMDALLIQCVLIEEPAGGALLPENLPRLDPGSPVR